MDSTALRVKTGVLHGGKGTNNVAEGEFSQKWRSYGVPKQYVHIKALLCCNIMAGLRSSLRPFP